MVKPEQAIQHVQAGLGVQAHGRLIARTTGWSRQRMSKDGVWHTHNTSAVQAHLRKLTNKTVT